MVDPSALEWRIIGSIFVLLGLLFAAWARRVPEAWAKRGLNGSAYLKFGCYVGALGFGYLGAVAILAGL